MNILIIINCLLITANSLMGLKSMLRSDSQCFNPRLSFLMGGLLAIPMSYPAPPYYWFSFIVMLVWFVRGFSIDRDLFFLSLLFVLFIMLSALVNSNADKNIVAFIGALFFVAMLNFRWDNLEIIEGYVLTATGFGLCMFILFLVHHEYHYGLRIFLDYKGGRLWGVGKIYDWPNYAAMIFSAALLFSIYLKKGPLIKSILFLSLLMTTLRLFFEVVAILIFYKLMNFKKQDLFKWVFLVALFIVAASFIYYLIIYDHIGVLINLKERIVKHHNRAQLYLFLYKSAMSSPFFGHGYAGFDFHALKTSHNSYLSIFYRYGVFCLFLFVSILMYILRLVYKVLGARSILFSLVLLLYMASFFNDYLRTPPYVMILGLVMTVVYSNIKTHEELPMNKNRIAEVNV